MAGAQALRSGALAEAASHLEETLKQQALAQVTLLDVVRARRLLGMALHGLGRVADCAMEIHEVFRITGHAIPLRRTSVPMSAERLGLFARALTAYLGRNLVPALYLQPRLPKEIVHEMELLVAQCADALVAAHDNEGTAVLLLILFVLGKQAGSHEFAVFEAGHLGRPSCGLGVSQDVTTSRAGKRHVCRGSGSPPPSAALASQRPCAGRAAGAPG